MAYVWITDIHLDFLKTDKRHLFYTSLIPYEGVLCSGDISNSRTVFEFLAEMYKVVQKPIYYVLGNHDYYGSDIETVRQKAEQLNYSEQLDHNVIYLTRSPSFLELRPKTFLIGVDGWACSKAGYFMRAAVRLNDSNYITDLRFAEFEGGRKGLGEKMHELSYNDMCNLEGSILHLLKHKEVEELIIVTHVPVFTESSRYLGNISGPDFLPFFCNVTMGKMIFEQAKLNPEVKFTVLAGHTHDRCFYDKLPNLKIMVGGAQYGNPEIASVILDD